MIATRTHGCFPTHGVDFTYSKPTHVRLNPTTRQNRSPKQMPMTCECRTAGHSRAFPVVSSCGPAQHITRQGLSQKRRAHGHFRKCTSKKSSVAAHHLLACLPAGSNNQRRSVAVAATTLAVAAQPAPATISTEVWQTLAVLSFCAAASQLLENHTNLVSAPLLALLAALTAAAAGLLPPVSPVYDVVWNYLMPLAVALYLLEQDLSGLLQSGQQVLWAFLLGAAGMLAGCFVSWSLLGQQFLGQHGGQLAACLVASYIGGSVNFAAVAAATQLPAALVPAAVAADNLAMLVLLTALMAVPARVISSWGSRSNDSRALELQALPVEADEPARSRTPSSGAGRSSLDAAVGRDGKLLLTAVPSAHEVAACFAASARGRGASSSSIGNKDKVPSGSQMQQQQQQHQAMSYSTAATSRKVGQLALDGAPLLTPDPDEDHQLYLQQQQQRPRHRQLQSTSEAAASAALSATGAVGVVAAAPPGKEKSSGKPNCGGCRASGITALDQHPLLTTAPAMADAINTIAAAREGIQTLVLASPEGSTPDDPAAGCGCCDQALDAIAAAPASSPLAALAGGSSGSPGRQNPASSGPLGLDNAPLLTAEPDGTQLAAAVTAAKKGIRGGQISVSDSVSSLSSSDSDEDLELLLRFSMKDLRRRLEEQQRQHDEQRQSEEQQQQQDKRLPGQVQLQDQQQQQQQQQVVLGVSRPRGTEALSDARSGKGPDSSAAPLTQTTAAASLAAAVLSAAASQKLASWWSAPALQLLLLSGIALGISVATSAACKALEQQRNLTQQTSAATGASAGSSSSSTFIAAASVSSLFSGATSLGQVLMGLFFATLGASCSCSVSSLAAAAPLFVFVAVMVTVHWLLLAAVGPVLGLQGPALLAGSVANIGGPATAAGIVSGRGLGQQLVQPSLLCGSLGYAIGTAAGLLVARVLGVLPS